MNVDPAMAAFWDDITVLLVGAAWLLGAWLGVLPRQQLSTITQQHAAASPGRRVAPACQGMLHGTQPDRLPP